MQPYQARKIYSTMAGLSTWTLRVHPIVTVINYYALTELHVYEVKER